MRNLSRRGLVPRVRPAVLAVALALLPATPSSAGPLGFSGSLTLSAHGLPDFVVAGSGIATVNGAGVAGLPITALSIPAGAFATTATRPPATPLTPIVQFRAAFANGPIVLSAGAAPCMTALAPVTCAGTGLHGRGGLVGVLAVGLSGALGSPLFTIPVPVGAVGGGGMAAGSNATTGGTVQLFGAGWTTGKVAAFTMLGGVPVGSLTAMGGQGATPGGRFALQMVSPVAIRTNLVPGLTLPGIVTLDIAFVPEPSTGLLLALGALGLAGARRARSGARSRP
jgi:PEP-CTERM motif